MSSALRAVLGVVAAASVGACTTPVAGHDDEPVTASPSVAEPAPARVAADTPAEKPAPAADRASGPDPAIELCGETCVTLKRDVPQLVARWRIEGLSDPAAPSATWDRGDLLEIRFDGASSHVWTAEEGTAHAMAYGSTTITSTGADTFDVTFTPRDVDASASLRLWGAPLRSGEPRSLSARRLPRERLEVCASADDCATLERQFDAYHYDLD